MPTYEYLCDACGHTFDEFQSMLDKPLKVCPECKKRKLRRLIGAGAGLVFKGSGFYITDYKKGGDGGSAAKTDGGGESKSESTSKSESKSESKPKSKSKKKD